ncbi:hypothetical protein [uncultured Alteromonas sp.]|uniref:hypothetical protein n=1 Tax=uncultured Alteromonas sp. TaxID=179113 RepID=UPI0025DF6453|nr:hypothetical protein [uncultured Alteromonas sp.]
MGWDGVVGENDKSLLSWQFDQAGEPLHVLAAEISASSGFTLVTGAASRGIVTGTHYGSGKVAISLTNQSREGNSLALLPQVDHVNQNLACSVIYPASAGWQHLRLSATNETVFQALYIYDDNDWQPEYYGSLLD